ncbi:MAG: DNA mismatch repair endonuclease MutL [Erysipelotrichaceae bacterium]
MSNIRLLDNHLTNLIAAGEVVDRPVSIVKELVENAIDAKSTNIEVRIYEGGMESIVVSDNGIGMDYTDANNAFLAHYTSKISSEYDLFNVETLGFRGEALPSISAVSHMELLTNNEVEQTKVVYDFGKKISSEYFPGNKGTTISVSKLFYQTPSRLKHLKSKEYEKALITDLMQRMALSFINISFQYYANDKLIFQTRGNGDTLEIIYRLFGSDISKYLKEIKGNNDDYTLSGYICEPFMSRPTSSMIIAFLNQRIVNIPFLNKTIIKAYSDYLPSGRYPIVILNIQADNQLIDVNVNASKASVRISKEDSLKQIAYDTIMEKLCHKTIAKVDMDVNKRLPNVEKVEYVQTTFADFSEQKVNEKNQEFVYENLPQVIGQLNGKYILASTLEGLLIIDQHAANERINYEMIIKQIDLDNIDYQDVQFLTYNISLSAMDRLSTIQEQAKKMGLIIEQIGPSQIKVDKVALWLTTVDVDKYVNDVLDYLNNNETIDQIELRKKALATAACHLSYKFNDYFSKYQMEELIKKLYQCDNPYNCPHGRPTIISISEKYLLKEFNRE